MTEILSTGISITCHAWNKDRTKFACCPNNNELHFYKKDGTNWVKDGELIEHDAVITGIDWAPNTNRIVTCSQDRNAYVWSLDGQNWKPTLVILRIQRGATSVKWSPKETKFAVSSGAKCVAVCYFEKENDWWLSKIMKKHKSTVLSLAWHPNNVLFATASSDSKVRVFSGWIKGLDDKPGPTPFGNKLPFSELLAEYECHGWVHNVAWSASGTRLCFVAHDSTITIVDATNGPQSNVQVIKTPFLPLSDCLFLSETSVVAVGHDCSPLLFSCGGDGKWAFTTRVEQKKEASAQKQSGTAAAFALFKNKVEVGADKNVQKLETLHQNCITCVAPFTSTATEVKSFTTSALDGKMVLWTL